MAGNTICLEIPSFGFSQLIGPALIFAVPDDP
jgi:hypothetical protein